MKKVLIIGLVAAVAFLQGCFSGALPPRPQPELLEKARRTHFNATVAVEAGKCFPIYAEDLKKSLEKTNLFQRVSLIGNEPNALLIARVEREIYGTPTVPIFTGLSLGIIPTVVEEEWGNSFSLRRKDSIGEDIKIDFSYKGPSVLGWVCGIINLFPGRTGERPSETRDYYEALAAEIVKHSDEINVLIEEEKINDRKGRMQ